MPNPSRLTGRFFSVLISIIFAFILPRSVAAANPAPLVLKGGTSHFTAWSIARVFTPAENFVTALSVPVMDSGGGLTLCQINEGVFGNKSGASKKAAALSFVQTAVSATDAIASKNVIDPNKFQDGLSKVIDGVVQCLNASVWANQH